MVPFHLIRHSVTSGLKGNPSKLWAFISYHHMVTMSYRVTHRGKINPEYTHSISKMRCFFLWQQTVNILIEYRGNFCERLMIVCLYYSSESHHWCTKLWNFSKCVLQRCWPQHLQNIFHLKLRYLIACKLLWSLYQGKALSTINISGHVSSVEVWIICYRMKGCVSYNKQLGQVQCFYIIASIYIFTKKQLHLRRLSQELLDQYCAYLCLLECIFFAKPKYGHTNLIFF